MGSTTPKPKYDRLASKRIACPMKAVIRIKNGAVTFGNICLKIILTELNPFVRAASTDGSVTTANA